MEAKKRLEIYKFLKTIYSLMRFDNCDNGICFVLENSLNYSDVNITDLTELMEFTKNNVNDFFYWDNDDERFEAIQKAIDKIYFDYPAIETPNQLELFK